MTVRPAESSSPLGSPKRLLNTVPKAWATRPDAWYAHVAECPYCSLFHESGPKTEETN